MTQDIAGRLMLLIATQQCVALMTWSAIALFAAHTCAFWTYLKKAALMSKHANLVGHSQA